MDSKAEQPPQKRKKKNRKSPLPPSLSSLPDGILLNCLARTSKSQYRVLSVFSKSIRSLVSSTEIYTLRSRLGSTEPCLYLCQQLPTYDRWFALDRTLITDGWIKDELSLLPITPSSSAPSKSTTVAVGFEIYQIGGIINKRPSSAVRVLDCRTHTWRDAPNMTVARTRAEAASFSNGKIYVYGGREDEDPMNFGEVFDLETQTWNPLNTPRPWHRHPVPTPWTKNGNVPWCVIENVNFCVFGNKFKWYDEERIDWFMVKGLEGLKHVIFYPTIHLANYGGKLVILWHNVEPLEFPVAGKTRKHLCKIKRIWCAVIRLVKHIGSNGLEILGEIEQSNAVLTVPYSYKILNCVTL